MTRGDLLADLRALGVSSGATPLVHASMRRVGWITGGAMALADAVSEALGPYGTLVVPTPTTDNSDTSRTHLARTAGGEAHVLSTSSIESEALSLVPPV